MNGGNEMIIIDIMFMNYYSNEELFLVIIIGKKQIVCRKYKYN